MTIKTILACLTSVSSAPAVIAAATVLARRHNAHLIGLHTVEALMIFPGAAIYMPNTVYEAYGTSQVEHTKALKAIFEKHTHAEQFVSEWRLLKSETDSAADRIVQSAASADILVMAGVEGEVSQPTQMKLLENVITDAGRPVLVVPSTFKGDVLGQSILVGWNGTREAVRAAHDALSVLQEGDTAHILHVNVSDFDADRDVRTLDLASAFARHGIKTTVTQKTWDKPGVAAAMNKQAFEKGADMIVVGAFGHSRAYDLVIGGATRDLLRHSTLPVLLSR